MQIYRKAVLHALADAFVSRRLRSISFTALGIGQRLRYPAPLLASWLLDGVLEFARVSAHVRTAINPKLPHLVRIVLPSRLILDTGYTRILTPYSLFAYASALIPCASSLILYAYLFGKFALLCIDRDVALIRKHVK